MTAEIKLAIEELAKRATAQALSPDAAQKFSQAALNFAHTLSILESLDGRAKPAG